MNRQRIRQFLIHPITLTCAITLVIFIAGALAILFYVLPQMFTGLAAVIIPEPHLLTGNQAQSAIESYIGSTLTDATDFYYYDYYGPSDSQSQMRFTIPPTRLNKIFASTSNLCFGVELTPNPTVYFVTPILPLSMFASNPTKDTTTSVLLTPAPTQDYGWMTPPPDHQYAGNHCSKPRAVYYNIRVDQTDPQLWTVWIQGYRS